METVASPADTRPPLVCDCGVRVVDKLTGELLTVRGAKWSCPSCGLNKRRALADIVQAAAAASDGRYSMVTLTYAPTARAVRGVTPERHKWCRRSTHVRRFDSGWFWTVQADCASCLREDSARFSKWRKRFHRRWPAAVFLVVREATQKGVLHLHVIVTGLPFVIRPKSRAERLVREHWAAVGGGFVRATLGKGGNPERAGRYVAKYASKQLSSGRRARRFRMWRRSRGFGPEVRMFGYREVKPPRDPSEMVAQIAAGGFPRTWQYFGPADRPPADPDPHAVWLLDTLQLLRAAGVVEGQSCPEIVTAVEDSPVWDAPMLSEIW